MGTWCDPRLSAGPPFALRRANAGPHLLIVDDERDIREPLAPYLGRNGHRVMEAANAAQARELLAVHAIDLVLLDVMMPGEDGLSLAAFMRATSSMPVILLTAKAEETDRIVGVEVRLEEVLWDEGLTAKVRAAMVAPKGRAADGRARATGAPPGGAARRRALARGPDRHAAARPAAYRPARGGDLLVYAIVLGGSVWIALRLARPLGDLTRAAESFCGRRPPPPLEPGGPEDLKGAMAAFNTMNARLVALLDERDRMLGAIGHDLRTPLALLRIRLEEMTPKQEREAAIAKLTEIGDMLEDIIALARSGQACEGARIVDLSALVGALVEERRVAAIQPGLVRRAVDNLLDNAVRYAGSARVSVRHHADGVAIEVADDGPGIPPDELERVLEPFHRLEGSRGRHTDGSGLGLAIARSVAQSRGGRIEFAPALPLGRELRATLILPA